MDNMTKLLKLQQGTCMPATFYEDRYQHCRQRIAERFQVDLSYDEWQELNLRVFMEDEGTEWIDIGDSTNSSLVIVELGGTAMLTAFTEVGYCMMTVFPRSDMRLFHARNNTYTPRATSGLVAYRDARRELADRMDELVDDGFGRLVMPKASTAPVEQPKAGNVFADALRGFNPAPKRPVLTLAASTPEPVSVSVPEREASPSVLLLFAQLHHQFEAASQRLEDRANAVADEIECLEARLSELRRGDEGSKLEREFIDMSRALAEQAFAKFQDGILDDASAMSLVRLMLAQVAPVAPVAVKSA